MKTITVDDYNRVRLPDAKPRQVLAYENAGGTMTLTPVEPVQARPAKVTVSKRGRFTIGVLDRDINESALSEALAEFP